jgi:hypothetical protein
VDITHDAADDGFHEIQLSGKQLVFLFMATTFVSILIFICGVLVGRGVRSEREAADATVAARAITTPASAPAATPAATPAPAPAQSTAPQNAATVPPTEPPSPPADDELTYAKRLEGKGTPPEQLKTQSTAARAETRPEPVASEGVQAPKPAPVATTAASDPAPVAQGGRPGKWVVQLVALRDRGAASSIVQRLSSKGYPAFVVNPAPSASSQVYKVQVGRYNDRNEAERVSKRLEKEEKFNPWISR